MNEKKARPSCPVECNGLVVVVVAIDRALQALIFNVWPVEDVIVQRSGLPITDLCEQIGLINTRTHN